nr:mucin-17-like isoform X5 [Procambarus clarkii]
MVRVLVVLRGGYPWGFRMQGGGDKPLIVSKVTSTGKAGGAGVRAGCAVKAINGTPTAQLSLSHAHALTKQGSTLTLEIDEWGHQTGSAYSSTGLNSSEEPRVASLSNNSLSSSTSTSSTVVAANGHISSRRRTESGSSGERGREPRPDDHSDKDKSEDSSNATVIILETYGADPDLLRSDQEEDSTDSGTDATQDFSLDPSDSSLNLSNISGTSDLDFGTTSRGSNESDEGSSTDQGSHTDTSTDTLVADDSHFQTSRTDQSEEAFVEYDRATGAFIEYPETRVTYNEQGRTSGGLEDHTGTYGTYRELDQTFGVFVEYSALKETYREKDLITGALIEYPNDNSDDERLTRTPTLEDSSFFDENGDSFFLNFEEELKQVEVQYPDLRAEHLLSNQEEEEEEIEEVPLWLYETAKEGARYSTIPEEGEEEETVVLVPPGKLEATAMGQYYSSASGGGPSGGEVSGSLASSPRSSEEWRMSMASTATVASTGTADSDDTLAKDMSELSSVNSRLSSLDEAHDEKKSPHISQSVIDPKATSKGTAQPDHKRQTSIKDAIDELESIEQAAQTLLQKRQFSTEDDRPTLVTATDTPTIHPYCASLIKVNPNEKLSPQSKRKVLPNLPEISEGITKEISAMKPDKEVHLQTTEASTSPISLVINGDSTAKGAKMESETRSEIKPPLPPAAGSHSPKQEVKRRFWSRPKELQPYISRESYNEERILKELERLRRSYQEGDLNDFLDALENTPFSDDIEEAFLRQLLVDIGEDVEGLPQEVEDSAQPQEETQVEQMEPSAKPIHEVPTESPRSSLTAGKFEKVKERIVNIITVRRAGRVIDTGNCEKTITPKDDTKTLTDSPEDSGRSETLQSISPVTPQSLIPDTTDSKSSRPQTPDVTKDDGKKSFNIADLLKKGSPKYLRKKYKERKNRKSDLMTTSESESEDPDGSKKETGYSNSTSQKKSSFTESQSSLKGSNRSLNSSQELKKEVRFDLDPDGQRKGLEESSGKDTKTEFVTPMVVDKVANHKFSGPQMITCEAQLQETIILKEFEETTEEIESDVSFTLPAMVEDINSRAETLLPRLPERVRPPRKKKRFIPAPVEELSAGDLSVGVTSPVASCGSQKGGESNTEFLVINTAAKEESPPPLPHYEELMDLPKTTPKCVEVVEKASYEDITSVAKQEFVDSTVTKGIISYTKSSQQLPYVACTTIMTQGPSAAATLSTPVTSAAPPQTNDSTFDTFEESLIVDTPLSAVESVPPTSTPADFPTTSVSTSVVDVEVLVSPLVVTTVASISVAPAPEDATLLIYPARTLPLPVIPECLQEDQMSIPTPSEPTVSFSSYGGSAPTTPYDEEEKLPSLYDNVNPFEEMLELENKLLQDDASEPSTVTSTASEPPILTSAASEPPILTSAASEPPILISTASELPTVTSTASAPPVVTSIAVEIEEETTKIETVIVSQLSKDENKSNHFGLPQEAYKSPDIEKSEVVDIDALAALTVEMFRFTQDMDKSLPREESKPVDSYTTSAPKISTAQNTCKSYIKSTLPTETASGDSATGCEVLQSSTTMPGGEVSKTKLSKTLSPKQGELNSKQTKETVTQTEPATAPRPVAVKERATSSTIAIQTDDTRYVLMSEASSQTDTEYETDLETESEMEENATNTYDASKWLFGPSRDSNLPLSTPRDPQMQELHRQQQAMILELQQQNLMQERRQKEKPEVPPRQFQEKMPLKVVNELKTVLSEVEESGPRLKKVADPPPRRDTDFSWNNDDLATIPEEVVAPSARAVGGIDARQQPRHLADPSISSPLDKLQAPTTHLEIPAKHVKALQELGLDESTLLSEIEQILGFGSLSRNRTEKPTNTTSSSSSRPDSFEKPVKLEKPNERKPGGEKPRVPERDSSKGVWSPGRSEDEGTRASGPSKIDLPDLPSFKDQPSVWSPGRGQNNTSGYNSRIHDPRPDHPSGRDPSGSASPSLGRKEYRKITYDGPITPQRRPSQEGVSTPRPEESFAWKDINVEKVARSPTSTSLPKVQNPTVTLLQKKREGQIPGKRPEYLKPDDTGPKYKPDDKLYVIKREYGSEDEEGGRRFAVLGPKKVQGVGPTTNDGVPTTLKSGVRSEHQGEWYRRMFDSLHKVKDDDHIIIKYKVPRARYGGYLSEPEGYDSDVGSSRYATLDRRRQHHFEVDPMTSSLPRDYNSIDLDPYSRNTSRYVHQPGRIEDYVPGYSSLSEKELKKNPEADVKLESHSQEPPPVSVNHRFGSQKMSMTHALKESGYESDSTLVFRKREDARRQIPDPRKTSQVYRQIQRGGDIPFTGLQKANPPRPREPVVGPLPFPSLYGGRQEPPERPESPYKYESGEVNIHYRTPVRIEQKESIPEEELARRQEEHMKKVYENERRKKYLAELEDIERRRHTDNFTPLQKSPIPLNRYDDESSLGTMRGARTPDLKQVAKALYNFTAQNKRELTFNKGDVIFIRRQIDKNWYEGEFRGSVGIFPCNYIEIVPYENVKTLTRKPTEGQARARFNFQAQTSMEMSLSKGELVVLTRRVDENWYEGRIGNRKGIFPVSYVDTLVEPGSDRPSGVSLPVTPSSSSPMPRPALPAANLLYNGASTYSSPYSTLGRPGSQNDSRPYNQSLTVNTQQEPVAYRALYNYKPQNDDELELLESDIVMVMEKCDDGWFVGTSRRTGLFGTFPGNYVERV